MAPALHLCFDITPPGLVVASRLGLVSRSCSMCGPSSLSLLRYHASRSSCSVLSWTCLPKLFHVWPQLFIICFDITPPGLLVASCLGLVSRRRSMCGPSSLSLLRYHASRSSCSVLSWACLPKTFHVWPQLFISASISRLQVFL